MKNWVFWLGMVLLVVDLLSYWTAIKLYFTTLGIILLIVSIVLLIASQFIKKKGR
jgi:hypothetical protein